MAGFMGLTPSTGDGGGPTSKGLAISELFAALHGGDDDAKPQAPSMGLPGKPSSFVDDDMSDEDDGGAAQTPSAAASAAAATPKRAPPTAQQPHAPQDAAAAAVPGAPALAVSQSRVMAGGTPLAKPPKLDARSSPSGSAKGEQTDRKRQLSPSSPLPRGVAAQAADCQAKIAELQRWKKQRLEQEDYMGAHHVKQLIEEQEQKLLSLQHLDHMPTPVRSPAPGGLGNAEDAALSQDPAPAAVAVAAAGAAAAAAVPEPEQCGPRVSVAFDGRRRRSVLGQTPPKREDSANEEDDEDATADAAGQDHDDDQSASADDAEASEWRPLNDSLMAISAGSDRSFTLPLQTYDRLYGYQRGGVAWMGRLWMNNKGGILADEMGLGKTVQVCAFLDGARKAGATHALMLLPVTLVDQWHKEARKWCPGWPVYTFYGSQSQRARALRRVQRPAGGILLTTYNLMTTVEDLFQVAVDDLPSPRRKGKGGRKPQKRRRMDDDEEDGGAVSEEEVVDPEIPEKGLPRCGMTKKWDVVICDEAHKIKNISTLLGKSLRKLHANSRLLLTGTPVQNALGDLWSLMDFAQPGLLGNHATFRKKFSDPIDKGSLRGASPFAVELKNHLASQLRDLISPHLLRRTKQGAGLVQAADDGDVPIDDDTGDADETDVKKLPPKRETIIWLAPSEDQVEAYQKILEHSEIIREACSKSKLGVEVFRAIGLLKKLCNHPLTLLPTPKAGVWSGLLSECMSAAGDADSSFVPSDVTEEKLAVGGATVGDEEARCGRAMEAHLKKLPRSTNAIRGQSSKLRCLSMLLPALAKDGHRTLVFSSSLKMLDLIQVCCLKPHGMRCLRIDGQTDALTRAEKVQKFNEQRDRFQCMLLTTNVGGVGLNLTSADRVVLVDPAWNPATDAQAVDRAFRIGQEREVRVYRLIMSGLIEDKMFRLQVFKMGLTRTALEANQQQSYFNAREIRALFEWTDPAQGETRSLLLEKHGEEDEREVMALAEEDGCRDGWFEAGPAVGLSDFSKLYSSVAEAEEKIDDEANAQVQEAKQKLSAADEKLNSMAEARRKAEADRDRMAAELELSLAALQGLGQQRVKADEAVRQRRGDQAHARRLESAAQQGLDKALKAQMSAKDVQSRAEQASKTAAEAADGACKSAAEAGAAATVAEEHFSKVMRETEGHFCNFDESGRAAREGVVDAAAAKLRMAVKAMEKLRAGLDAMFTRRAELESIEDELLKADENLINAELEIKRQESADVQAVMAKKSAELLVKSREKDRQRAEQAYNKAMQQVMELAQAVSDAGIALADSFQKSASNPVKADQVKSAISTTKAAFRAVGTSWGGIACTATKKAREAWVKAMAQRRKALQKLAAAASTEAEAARQAVFAEEDYKRAVGDEERAREDRLASDKALATAETVKTEAEAAETAQKRRREELKAAQPTAREAVRAAKAAEKEAAGEQTQLHLAYSKVERQHSQMELAKDSAMQSLKNEEYDNQQVKNAYEKQRARKNNQE